MIFELAYIYIFYLLSICVVILQMELPSNIQYILGPSSNGLLSLVSNMHFLSLQNAVE